MIEIPHGAWLGTYTDEKLINIWNRIKGFDNLFADDNMKNPEVFLKTFLDRNSVVLETAHGFMYAKNIQHGLKAEVHFCFWDKKLSIHAELVKDCLLWLFLQFDLQRVETQVAEYARAVRRFITEKLGFVYEGTRRNYVYHKNRLIDMHMYSILREEALNG
jgi:hypothetical protein